MAHTLSAQDQGGEPRAPELPALQGGTCQLQLHEHWRRVPRSGSHCFHGAVEAQQEQRFCRLGRCPSAATLTIWRVAVLVRHSRQAHDTGHHHLFRPFLSTEIPETAGQQADGGDIRVGQSAAQLPRAGHVLQGWSGPAGQGGILARTLQNCSAGDNCAMLIVLSAQR